MKGTSHWWHVVALAGALAIATPVGAQEAPASSQSNDLPDGFWLTTPYPEFALPLGEEGNITLSLRNSGLPPQRAELEVSGLPAGWEANLTGAGKGVSAAMVGPDEVRDLTLNLVPPENAAPGAYPFQVAATSEQGTVTLPLQVELTEDAAGGVTLTPELPALRGSPTSNFQFRIKVANESGEDALFNLAAQVPEGLRTTFKRGFGSEEITGIPVAAGATETVTLEVKPMPGLPAGRYPVKVATLAGDVSAEAELSLEVTGTPELDLIGPQERLSGSATAGEATTFPFTLQSSGSAPAQNVKLAATPPSGWEVTFEPEEIPVIEPGTVQEVGVTIKPSEKAIAGDYMVSLRVNGDGISESAQFRTTVNTSTIWGMAGIGVIGMAVLILVFAVLRYGRR